MDAVSTWVIIALPAFVVLWLVVWPIASELRERRSAKAAAKMAIRYRNGGCDGDRARTGSNGSREKARAAGFHRREDWRP